MPDWKSTETTDRLIAAIVASNGNKVDNMAIARYMNETYDAIENRMRVYKKQAQKIAQEAEDAGRMHQDMRKRKEGGSASPRKPRGTPKKSTDLHGVTSGRVAKSPAKKKAASVKHEISTPDSSAFGDVDKVIATGNSFAFADMNFPQPGYEANLVDHWDSGLV